MQLNQFRGAGILGREVAKRASGQLVYRKDPEGSEGAFIKKYHQRGFYDSHSSPLPLIVFPAHFFFKMPFARSTQDKRHV